MKLARLGPSGEERPVLGMAEGGWFELADRVDDVTGELLTRDLAPLAAAARAGQLPEVPLPDLSGRWAPPLAGIGKIICVGLNYSDHADETGSARPLEPPLFLKAPDTVVGPNDSVVIPRRSEKTDWEVELAVVIGRPARYLESTAEGLACVAGYAISHDVSEREFQLERGGQWDKGKNCETFNPLGPWIATADEIADPQGLGLRLWVNDDLRQDGHTKNMIFGVGELIRYISQFMVLHPGDVVNTGTPGGVAMGRPNHPYLRPGDVVELEIDGLGRQRQVFGAA